MFDINFIINVLIQVLCIFIFLSVFFFTYASNVEGKVVENQVNFLLDDIFGININCMPDNIKAVIKNKVNGIEINSPENISLNEKINKSNDEIKNKTKDIAIKASIVVGIIVIVSFILSKNGPAFFKNLDLVKITKETIVILIAVALTEFIFLVFLGSKYISISPHLLKGHFFENLKNSLP